MYQLIRAYTQKDRRNGRWTPVDLTEVSVRDVPQLFSELCMVITYPALNGDEQALFFEDVANLTKDALHNTTVQQWLTSLGNSTIPLREDVPTFEERFVKYINAWYGNFQLDPIGPSRRLESNVSKYDKDDIHIQHDTIGPQELRKQVMVSVNGYFHFIEYADEGIIVHEGNRSVLTSGYNQVGIHSFKEIGEVNYIPIDDGMTYRLGDDTPLCDGVYIDLPGTAEDYKNKTVLFVFNGYLQTLGKSYNRVGETTFRVDMFRLLMLERYYQSRNFLDMKDIPITNYEGSDNLVSVSEFHSDEVTKWFLNRSQTFFVVVDTPSMFNELEPVEHVKIPGRFMDHQHAEYPMVGVYGKTLEYRALRYPGNKNVMATIPNERHRFDFNTQPWRENAGVTDGRNSYRPFTHEHAYWRLLGTQV